MLTRHRPWLPFLLVAALAAAAVVSLAAPRDVAAQNDARVRAKEHFQRGSALYQAGDFRGAIGEFQAADRLAPSGVNDFNIGLAHDALGERAEAIRADRSYLARTPDASNRATVEASIKRLDAELAAARDASAEDVRRAEEARLAEEARRAEEARLAEEARRKAALPPDGGGGDQPGALVGGTSTGDPELDRAAAVDINQVRAQRQLAPPVAGAGTVGAAGGGGGGAQGAQPAGGPAPDAPKAKPVYKQWWFWVVAGVSAYVLISILAADSSSQPGAVRAETLPLPPIGEARGAGAAGLTWRF